MGDLTAAGAQRGPLDDPQCAETAGQSRPGISLILGNGREALQLRHEPERLQSILAFCRGDLGAVNFKHWERPQLKRNDSVRVGDFKVGRGRPPVPGQFGSNHPSVVEPQIQLGVRFNGALEVQFRRDFHDWPTGGGQQHREEATAQVQSHATPGSLCGVPPRANAVGTQHNVVRVAEFGDRGQPLPCNLCVEEVGTEHRIGPNCDVVGRVHADRRFDDERTIQRDSGQYLPGIRRGYGNDEHVGASDHVVNGEFSAAERLSDIPGTSHTTPADADQLHPADRACRFAMEYRSGSSADYRQCGQSVHSLGARSVQVRYCLIVVHYEVSSPQGAIRRMSHHDLLEVQRLDVEAEQLLHKRAVLPQREQLSAAQVELQRLTGEIEQIGLTQIEVATRQKRYEDEAQIVAARIDADDVRLYSGEVTGLRDLQALQEEIASLRNRQSDLEDEALKAMEEAESLASQVDDLSSETEILDQRIEVLTSEIGSSEAEIDAQLEAVRSKRADLEAALDDSLIAEYQRLRPVFGSATVVRFEAGKCVGCPSVMPAMEVDRMKRSTADVLSCDECGRIVLI